MNGLLLVLLAATAPWEEQGVEQGITISTRAVEAVDAKEVRAIGRVEAPPDAVFAALIDVPHMTRNRTYTTEARLIDRHGAVFRYYQKVDPPVVSARDYILEGTLTRVGVGGYRMAFRAVTDARVPLRSGVVRLELIRGSWTVEPASGGKASTVTYQVLTDAKSPMPAFVANRATLNGTRDVFVRLREVAVLPEYRGVTPLLGDEPAPAAPGSPAPGTPAIGSGAAPASGSGAAPASGSGAAPASGSGAAPASGVGAAPASGPAAVAAGSGAAKPADGCDAAVQRLEQAIAALPAACAGEADCGLFALRAFPCAPEIVLPRSFAVDAPVAAPYRAALAATRAACKERIPAVVTCERVHVKAACRAGSCVDVARETGR